MFGTEGEAAWEPKNVPNVFQDGIECSWINTIKVIHPLAIVVGSTCWLSSLQCGVVSESICINIAFLQVLLEIFRSYKLSIFKLIILVRTYIIYKPSSILFFYHILLPSSLSVTFAWCLCVCNSCWSSRSGCCWRVTHIS